MNPPSASHTSQAPPTFWWSNCIFFVSIHIAATAGIYYKPPSSVSWPTLGVFFILWQLANFGITIGYHRLYSHRAFRAGFAVRLLLAALGSAAFQGSIKWWCLRHRLHHRYTDDPVHDPYSATKGLFYSHMGWIFYKPNYERMELVDREDLDSDPIVRFQHKYYVPLALFFGFVLPPLLGMIWGDPFGAFVWGSLVSHLAIWHCTFLVNSLAHWDGLQPYSDENTSRGSLILALLTGGEGNHNFHAFPHDFRSGPSLFDWDPSKWIILIFNHLGLARSLRRAHKDHIQEAIAYMINKAHHGHNDSEDEDAEAWCGAIWGIEDVKQYIRSNPGRCVVLVHGFFLDVTGYLGEHPGGAVLLRRYSVRVDQENAEARDGTWAFSGGLNNHSRGANKRMRALRVAKYGA